MGSEDISEIDTATDKQPRRPNYNKNDEKLGNNIEEIIFRNKYIEENQPVEGALLQNGYITTDYIQTLRTFIDVYNISI